jgi:hypothetical protein
MSESGEELESSSIESGTETGISKRNLKRKYPVEVLSHWEHGFPGLQASSQEVYEAIENGVRALEFPGVMFGRALRSQGGLLSKKREYLQIRRERLIIEVCAAPFGPKFFFVSWRLSMILLAFDFLFVIVGTFASIAIGWFIGQLSTGGFGFILGLVIFLLTLRAKGGDMNEILEDLHIVMLRVPLVGQYWGLFVRPETYYRIDSAAAFRGAVHDVVLGVAGDLIKKQGGSPLSADERKPILSSLFGRR